MAYQKKKDSMTAKGGCKSVDRETFIEQLAWATSFGLDMRTGKPYRDKMITAAKNCGLSLPTFWKRADQFISPDIYGELPEGFFKGKSEAWDRKKDEKKSKKRGKKK